MPPEQPPTSAESLKLPQRERRRQDRHGHVEQMKRRSAFSVERPTPSSSRPTSTTSRIRRSTDGRWSERAPCCNMAMTCSSSHSDTRIARIDTPGCINIGLRARSESRGVPPTRCDFRRSPCRSRGEEPELLPIGQKEGGQNSGCQGGAGEEQTQPPAINLPANSPSPRKEQDDGRREIERRELHGPGGGRGSRRLPSSTKGFPFCRAPRRRGPP